MKNSVKSLVPISVKEMVRSLSRVYRAPTASLRLLPDFLVIGAQKCGTTSLYNLLKKHPLIAMSCRKETHYFDLNFEKNTGWYRSHFPTSIYKNIRGRLFPKGIVIGESTPYYIFHPAVPQRVSELLPDVKLIALLRNPVDRAVSHYHHEVRKGRETLPFEQAIQKEAERMEGEKKKLFEQTGYQSSNYRNFSYLSRGVYINQLQTWGRCFPKEQILVLKSEDFFDDPGSVLRQIAEFLDLPEMEMKKHKKYNHAAYPKMDNALRKQLAGYFEEHNQKLYEFSHRNFNWH